MTGMNDPRNSISTIAGDPLPAGLTGLFREYHEWNKKQVKHALVGSVVPQSTIESEYDIEQIIRDDVDRLGDPDSPAHLLVSHEDDSLAGCVYWDRLSPSTAEVRRLYVRPSHRGRGLGRVLIETLIEQVADAGYEHLRLNTGPHTEAAHALYDDLGFEPIAPYDCEIPETVHDDWNFMELALPPRD